MLVYILIGAPIVPLKLELGSPQVTPLGIIPDGIASLHPNPLENGTVLFHLLSQTGLDFQAFVGRHVLNKCLQGSQVLGRGGLNHSFGPV